MAKQILVPNAEHPITIRPTGERVVVRSGDQVIVDTTNALTLQESTYPAVQYVPLADIDPALLKSTDTQTYCPFKGDASYYSVVLPGQELTDVVWAYAAPYPAVGEIAGHVAFYPDKVDITVG